MKIPALIASLLFPTALWASPEIPALPANPDIRANILQMLEQGRQDGRSLVILDEAGNSPVAPLEADLFRQWAEESRPARQIEPPSEVTEPATPHPEPAPVKPPPPVTNKLEGEQHLILPEKEITISGPEDLKRLLQTFEDAREAQQER